MVLPVRSPLASPARRLPQFLYAGVAVLMIAFVVIFVLYRTTNLVPDSILILMHINLELSIPAWFNAALLLLAGVMAFLGLLTARVGERRGWVMLVILLTYLSADEAAAIHDQFRIITRRFPQLSIGSFDWLGPGLLVAAVGFAVAVYFGRALPKGLTPRLLVACLVFGAGALGVEMITGWVTRAHPDDYMVNHVLQTALQVIEESLEKIAPIMVISAILWLFERDQDRLPRLLAYVKP